MTGSLSEALSQVKRLQDMLLHRQKFAGYSGPARMISGTAALATAYLLDSMPVHHMTYLKGWVCLMLFCLVLNYFALVRWFMYDPLVKRRWGRLKPALEAMPPLLVGGLISCVLVRHEFYFLLYGVWMSMFGLAIIASRYILPRYSGWVGLFYVLCGTFFLAYNRLSFFNPWPMGMVFFIGEWVGGLILLLDHQRGRSMS